MKSFLDLIQKNLLVGIILLTISINTGAADIEPPFGIRNYDIGAAHDFTLHDIDGEKFQLIKTRGHWVFLHFWASWCGPCKEEMPAVQKMADILHDDEFQIVMINTAEDEDTIFEFLGTINVELNSLMDTDGQVTEVWKPRGLPTTFLINPQGEIKYQAIGGREWDKPEYIDFIKRLIKSAN
ncbi:MAG: TlpA family protein disulfide reductase [Gammaproteobacteria bacterium]|nr:TlpA family protein disulfide reductase [Gammaproteobacteria bacterium]